MLAAKVNDQVRDRPAPKYTADAVPRRVSLLRRCILPNFAALSDKQIRAEFLAWGGKNVAYA